MNFVLKECSHAKLYLTFWQKNYDDIDVYNIIAITYECTSFQYFVNADLSNIIILIKILVGTNLSPLYRAIHADIWTGPKTGQSYLPPFSASSAVIDRPIKRYPFRATPFVQLIM